MWPFTKSRDASTWDAILRDCNFDLARDEFADFFRMVNQEADAKGEQAVFRQELVQGWKNFSVNPNLEAARAWLRLMPGDEDLLLKIFAECCPGGAATTRVHRLKSSRARNASATSIQDGPAYSFGNGDGLTLQAAVAVIPLHLDDLRAKFKAKLGDRLTPEISASNAIDGVIAEMCKMIWLENKYGKEGGSNWRCGARAYLPGGKQSQELIFRDGSTVTMFFDFGAFHPSGWV